jgi:aspartate ammonia-lyase
LASFYIQILFQFFLPVKQKIGGVGLLILILIIQPFSNKMAKENRRQEMVLLNNRYRIEKDSMGPVRVPVGVYYGAQTQRAIENFPISGWRFGKEFLQALGLIKYAAAKVNAELGLLDRKIARAIEKASDEVIQGEWDEQFVLDIFQTGSGTSTNMNANEVIANRANEIQKRRGQKEGDVGPKTTCQLNQKGQGAFFLMIPGVKAHGLHLQMSEIIRQVFSIKKLAHSNAEFGLQIAEFSICFRPGHRDQ